MLFTALGDFMASGDPALKARTHLWMHPITGSACLGMEWVLHRFPDHGFWFRAPLYLLIIYAVEYTAGALLFLTMRARPWDYSDRGWNVHGFIRFDYAPFWLFAAWLFERAEPALEQLPSWV